jgi:ferrous iron transport protein A
LGTLARGAAGLVAGIRVAADGVLSALEMERRLLEMGFVEGTPVELLHHGWIGGDPIAVRVGDHRVALRRQEANAVLVELVAGACG